MQRMMHRHTSHDCPTSSILQYDISYLNHWKAVSCPYRHAIHVDALPNNKKCGRPGHEGRNQYCSTRDLLVISFLLYGHITTISCIDYHKVQNATYKFRFSSTIYVSSINPNHPLHLFCLYCKSIYVLSH